jgi:hypothetical protein
VSFCSWVGAALWILLLPLKTIQLKEKDNVPLWVGTKSMTGKTTEGLASGRAKKTGRVLINTYKSWFDFIY